MGRPCTLVQTEHNSKQSSSLRIFLSSSFPGLGKYDMAGPYLTTGWKADGLGFQLHVTLLLS